MDPLLAGSIIILLFYAFINATDVALLSLNDKKLEDMESEGKKVSTLKKLSDVSERYTEIVRLLLVTFSVVIFFLSFNSEWAKTMFKFFEGKDILWLGYIAFVLIITVFIVPFGELIPRKLAAAHFEPYALALSGFMRFLYFVMFPLTVTLEFLTAVIVRLLGVDPKTSVGEVTEEGLLSIVDEGEENGVIDEDEGDMINNIIEFGDTTAQKIMTHRTDIVAMPITADFHDVVALATDEHFSRIPIFDGTLDNIIGVLHIRALLKYIEKVTPEKFDLKSILNDPYFVPQSKKANDLLKELQSEKTHMAIVIDEYGGTAGIVTMEDLIEFVFGNIQDEFDDEEEEETRKVDEQTYEVDGTADFEETFEQIGIKLTKDEKEELGYEKMAGFVMGELDRIPVKGDKVEYKNYLFEVTEVDEKRIEKIKIIVPETDENEENGE